MVDPVPPQNQLPDPQITVEICELITAEAFIIVTPILSRTLSLIPSWSAMNASLGALSGVVVEVTHMVPSPGSGFVATQPGGSAGAVTLSKFSRHGPTGLGLADGVGVGVPDGVGLGHGHTLPRLYASTKPTPVPAFRPARITV